MCSKTPKLKKPSFWARPNIEKILTVGLPVILAILIGFSTNETVNKHTVNAIVLWFVTGILFVGLIILLFVCWHYQKKTKQEEEKSAEIEKEKELQKSNSINERYMLVGTFLGDYISSNIYNIKKFDINTSNYVKDGDKIWINFDKINRFRAQWNTICRDLCDLVNIIKEKGDQFGVNIILMCNKDGENGYYMPAHFYTYQANSRASIQNKIKTDDHLNTLKEENQYFYKTLFDNNFSRPVVLARRIDIEEHFKRNDRDQNQYIALPIKYYDKTFAILQVIAYKDSIICDGDRAEDDIMDLINNYFSIYERFALLSFILGLV